MSQSRLDFVAGQPRPDTLLLQGPEVKTELGEEQNTQQARVMQWYGFRSRIPLGTECMLLPHRGRMISGVVIAADTPKRGPVDDTYDVQVYSQYGQRLRFTNDGVLLLDAQTGQRVLLDATGRITIDTSAGSKVLVKEDGAVTLQDSSGGTATLKDGRLTVNADVARRHDLGTGASPVTTVSLVAVAASPGTAAVTLAGTDRLFRVKVTVGANNISAGVSLFSTAYAAAYTGTTMAQVTGESGTKVSYTTGGTTIVVTAEETMVNGTEHVFVISVGAVA